MIGDGSKKRDVGDEEILVRVQRGETELFRCIVERHKNGLGVFLGPYCRWDLALVEEMVQAAFVKVFEKRDSYKPIRSFRPWLYQVARNHVLDYLRRNRRQLSEVMGGIPPTATDGPEKELERKESARELVEAMQQLPARQHEVMDMVRQGLGYKEIAGILSISEVSVRVNLSHGIKALRGILGEGKK